MFLAVRFTKLKVNNGGNRMAKRLPPLFYKRLPDVFKSLPDEICVYLLGFDF